MWGFLFKSRNDYYGGMYGYQKENVGEYMQGRQEESLCFEIGIICAGYSNCGDQVSRSNPKNIIRRGG